MSLSELDRLVEVGTLTREPPATGEVSGLRRSGEARLVDAANRSLALESRFDLAYNAAHSLALAALRRLGFRPRNRYAVFQALTHTLSIPAATWRVLAKGHDVRNRAEYEGALDIDERLVGDMIAAATAVRDALRVGDPHRFS
jgi:hypothetical protein